MPNIDLRVTRARYSNLTEKQRAAIERRMRRVVAEALEVLLKDPGVKYKGVAAAWIILESENNEASIEAWIAFSVKAGTTFTETEKDATAEVIGAKLDRSPELRSKGFSDTGVWLQPQYEAVYRPGTVVKGK